MHKFVILLVVACGMNCSGDSVNDDGYSTGILKAGIKKNEVGANGRLEALNNLRNPVLERLFRRNKHSGEPENLPEPGQRKIRQIQPLTVSIDRKELLRVPILQPLNFIKSKRQSVRSLERTSGQNLKIKSQTTRKPLVLDANPSPPSPSKNSFKYVRTRSKNGIFESVVNSQILRVRGEATNEKDVESDDDEGDYQDGELYHEIETYPATAIVINVYNRDGTLKSSVTHFRSALPNFLVELASGRQQAHDATANHLMNRVNFGSNHLGYLRAMPPTKFPFQTARVPDSALRVDSYSSTGLSNLPNDNKFNSSEPVVCNAVSQAIKYKESLRAMREKPEIKKDLHVDVSKDRVDLMFKRYDEGNDGDDGSKDFAEKFDPKESEIRKSKRSKTNDEPFLVRRIMREKHSRNVRDITSIIMLKDSRGDRINVTVEQPSATMFGSGFNVNFSKGKSFSSGLPPIPPLSTVMKPSHQGYTDRKKKPKPEEGEGKEGGEEGGEDNEEGTSSEMTESTGESVAISPLPDGTSIAEAKPVGLAIAGPGGVAASKPHGTAVVGPGGLAIARPMGTAIAGVEVEGAVPVGGGNKNNKKPKQDKEQPEGELHYVGGLTGPIGNPQPIRKQFGSFATFKSFNENSGQDVIEGRLSSKGSQNNERIQFKLGQKDGKYGFFQTFSSSDDYQKVQAPAYFYGPVDRDKNVENVYENHFNRRRA